MEYTSGAIDPSRPWIRDPRDNPAQMNWVQTLFNPLGTTSKLHFSRAWTAMFLGRVLLYIVPSVIAGLAGMAGVQTAGLNAPVNLLLFTVPAVLLPFAVFTLLTEYTSFVVHVRRLTEAGRSAFWAIIVVIPLILGMICYALGTQAGAAQYRAMNAPKVETTAPGASGSEARPQARQGGQQRGGGGRGRGGPPPSERQMAMAAGMGMALPVWALASFGAMLWTLLHVARLPNGGKGRKRTGSDLTPEEIERGEG